MRDIYWTLVVWIFLIILTVAFACGDNLSPAIGFGMVVVIVMPVAFIFVVRDEMRQSVILGSMRRKDRRLVRLLLGGILGCGGALSFLSGIAVLAGIGNVWMDAGLGSSWFPLELAISGIFVALILVVLGACWLRSAFLPKQEALIVLSDARKESSARNRSKK